MIEDRYEAFIAGRRPHDVLVFLSDGAHDPDLEIPYDGHPVEGGTVYVIAGERGRTFYSMTVGEDVMAVAEAAMDDEGEIEPTLTVGTCPHCGRTSTPTTLFAFAEARNEAIGGLYAEGDVIHAYARCPCGEAYSDRWAVTDEE